MMRKFLAFSAIGAGLGLSTNASFADEIKGRGKKKKVKVQLPPPGNFQRFASAVDDTLAIHTFDGAKISVSKSTQFQDASLPPTPNPSKSLTMIANVNVGAKSNQSAENGNLSELQVFSQINGTHLQGICDGNGVVRGIAIVPVLKNKIVKTQFQVDEENQVLNFDIDWPGNGWNATVGAEQNGFVLSSSFCQSLTPNLAFGTQLFHVQGMKTFLDVALRYKENQDTYIASYSQVKNDVITLGYSNQTNENTQFATDINIVMKNYDSNVRIGMAHQHRQFQYKATIDSNLTTSMTLDLALAETLQFSVSGEINHLARDSQFGVGLSLNI